MNGLVEAVLRGEDGRRPSCTPRAGRNTSKPGTIDHDDSNNNNNDKEGGGEMRSTGDGDADGGPKDRFLDPSFVGENFVWQDLAPPAARLCAACAPFLPAQLDVLDGVIEDIFRRR